MDDTTKILDAFSKYKLDPLLEKTHGVVGGEARIAGTRLPVWAIIQLRKLGASDGEIEIAFERRITPKELKACWDYYIKNMCEIDKAIRENEK